MNTLQVVHSILTIDENSTIIQKHYVHQAFAFENLKDALDLDSITHYNNFIITIINEGYASGILLSLNIQGNYTKVIMSGIRCNQHIHLFAVYDTDEAITRELQSINNDIMNTLRHTIKDLSESKIIDALSEEKFLHEMTELNNQLINTQRKLVKKNIEIMKLNEKLQKLSITDPLTSTFNRRYFYEKINEEIARAKRNNYFLTILFIDLNNFKKINDMYGHEEGDRVLIAFSQIVKNNIRNNIDSIFRFGGDEFVLILVDCSETQAKNVAERLNAEIKKVQNTLSIACGIMQISPDEESIDIEKLLALADKKMYEHKKEMKMP